jgi:hypothetical protein
MAENIALTAPEAHALLSLPRFDGAYAVKLGLMELLARGVLLASEELKPTLLGRRRFLCLRVAENVPDSLPVPAASLIAVVRAAEPSGGAITAIHAAASRAYKAKFAHFLVDQVGPSLVARGLAEASSKRLLGMIPLTRFERTAAGEATRARIEAAMHAARAIPQCLDSDLAQAVALAAAAGSAILMVDGLRPYYRKLAEAMRDRGADLGYTPILDGGSGTAEGVSGGPDFGSFDFGGCDFGSFDGFESCFDAFDSGFDSADSSSSC